MSTNAYGHDFWIGQIWRPKNRDDLWRHVIVQDIRNGRAKCHNLIIPDESGKLSMWKRSSMISLKTLAQRWTNCRVKGCFCKPDERQPHDDER